MQDIEIPEFYFVAIVFQAFPIRGMQVTDEARDTLATLPLTHAHAGGVSL